MRSYETIIYIVADRIAHNIAFSRKLTLVAAAAAVIACPLVFGVINAPQLRAQTREPNWQIAAGGKISFDIASVKRDKSGDPPAGRMTTNVGLDSGDDFTPTGGLFRAANWPLTPYIGFAYKLTPAQLNLLKPQMPKWVASDRFDIEARAAGNPTKDQLRLTMQSLLADRFKLAVHFETRQLPVFAMVLVKPGKTGPQLRPYSDGPPCDLVASPPVSGAAPPPAQDPGWFLPCGDIGAMFAAGRVHIGARNMTMGQIAISLPVASVGALDRPVLDKTGLSGNFDLKLEFTPELSGPSRTNFQPDASGPTFLEALRDQLGLKLDSQTGPVEVIVLDHVEEPSEN
jgi:uncharacterized protein (TIGR03435 family)